MTADRSDEELTQVLGAAEDLLGWVEVAGHPHGGSTSVPAARVLSASLRGGNYERCSRATNAIEAGVSGRGAGLRDLVAGAPSAQRIVLVSQDVVFALVAVCTSSELSGRAMRVHAGVCVPIAARTVLALSLCVLSCA